MIQKRQRKPIKAGQTTADITQPVTPSDSEGTDNSSSGSENTGTGEENPSDGGELGE